MNPSDAKRSNLFWRGLDPEPWPSKIEDPRLDVRVTPKNPSLFFGFFIQGNALFINKI
jgi:hypothetical protein